MHPMDWDIAISYNISVLTDGGDAKHLSETMMNYNSPSHSLWNFSSAEHWAVMQDTGNSNFISTNFTHSHQTSNKITCVRIFIFGT